MQQTDPVRQLVRRRLDELGLNMREASMKLGKNHAYLQQFLERGVPRALPEDVREQLAALLGCTEGELRQRGGSPPDHFTPPRVREAPEIPPAQSLPRDIPIRGTGRGDNDGNGDFTFNGEVAGYVRRPPGLAGVRNAFALYVQGDSMSPWREPGQLVYVHPDRPPRIGDHVIVEMRPDEDGENGTVWIKKLVSRAGDGSLVLRQYNPPNDRIRLKGERVLRIYRVMEWDELMGV